MDKKIDFIGLGAAKSGTSWLAYLLEQHPEVELSTRKEVAYFNEKSFDGKPNDTYGFSLDYYHDFWSFKTHQLQGEFSPQYLFDPSAAAKIKAYSENLKFIVILRNPVDRAFSHFRYDQGFNQLISKKYNFEEALEQHPYLLETGKYGEQLNRYFKLFPKHQFKVFFLENAIANPRDTASSLYAFLGIDPEFCPNLSAVNESKEISDNLLTKLVQWPVRAKQKLEAESPLFRKVMGPLKQKKWYVHLVDRKTKIIEDQSVPMEKGVMSEEEKKRVKSYFEEDLKLLESLVGGVPPSWR